jgi:ABC-type transport system substrate-binding protein
MIKKNYAAAVDNPDSMLRENYKCQSENNFTKYCNPEVEALLDAQSEKAEIAKRKQLVGAIERKWPRMSPTPLSPTTLPTPLGIRTSKATCSTRTAFITTGDLKTSGSTNRAL